MNRTFVALTIGMALGTGCGQHQQTTDPQAQEMEQLLSEIFPEGEPGGAALVLLGDDVVFDKGYGIADIETRKTIDGDTFFNIASCSKQFTAVAVLQLVEQGLISTEDCIADYFPEYTDPLWKKVTIAHLLSHSSGIPDLRGGIPRELKVLGDENLSLKYFSTLDHLNFEPGTEYEYMNPTFVLLGRLVERVSGQEFTSYVKEHIFTPAGMDETLYFDRDHQDRIPRMSHGYDYDEPGEWYEYDFGEETFFATRPDGGIYASTHELVKWEKALRAAEILSPQMLAQAFTAQTKVSGSEWSDYQNRPGTYYGYGWFLEPEKGCIYHTGDNGGFKALLARYPEKQALVVILANRSDWERNDVKLKIEEIYGLTD